MTGRDAQTHHYPASHVATPTAVRRGAALLALALALSGCASVGGSREDAVVEASEPAALDSPHTGPAVPLDLRADDLLMQAMGLIGTRYRYGGTSPQQGFDCSGFTSYVFREALGVQLPRTASDQFAGVGSPVPKTELSAGDLVFFRQGRGRIDHVGIYVGEGRFIHSPSRGGRVRIDALAAPHWTRSYQGAKRVLGSAP